MAVSWEYDEFFVPYGENRDRRAMLDGLNKLGKDGWEVMLVKDIIQPTTINGKTLVVDGTRALCKRAVANGKPLVGANKGKDVLP